jgi:predicted  nucleic acid-binding Zn-ribbon protein
MRKQSTGADGPLLVELAGLDESTRERAAAWKDLVHRLDALRREIVVASAQSQRSRSRAERRKPPDDAADQGSTPAARARNEGRAASLTKEFEAALRDTERRRAALHAEMQELQRRREAILRQLPVPVSRAYRSLLARGAPAIAVVANGACGGCETALPASVVDVMRHGGVAACAHCERLLRPARPME